MVAPLPTAGNRRTEAMNSAKRATVLHDANDWGDTLIA
jgi:hypothetical protein